MARTPIRQAAQKAAPAHGRSRLRKNASQRSILDLPQDIVKRIKDEYSSDLQWVTYEVLGKSEPAMRQDFEINGWQAVTQDMFGGLLDGMYMKRGEKGEIIYGGMVLMERPYELTEESRAEEAAARNAALRAQENMIKGGLGIPGLSAGFESDHPTAVSKNVFKRSVERPSEIPTE
ncbi:hypothetical protein IC762_12315 [Bradyrhizobium genosp. L]|uniref:hypothetical protein n=1 Tax=Bradyrhizobium genosp. L TaxID=83637 RepID=UPI0018A2D20F|nr:hypothetical protein [Bradyrhizobium genosp. L]QPF87029.1 hypothetical protein IC762_12315 [Bradyrhizobium genosp. L]